MKRWRFKVWGDDGRPIDDFKSDKDNEIIDRIKRLVRDK